jgi:hypothetical protein
LIITLCSVWKKRQRFRRKLSKIVIITSTPGSNSGSNLTTSEFTTTTPALQYVDKTVFPSRLKYFFFRTH